MAEIEEMSRGDLVLENIKLHQDKQNLEDEIKRLEEWLDWL